jgi:predicted dehydrogenase
MRIGIIGAGQMGGYYANNLVTKCGFPAGDVVVHDLINERASTVAQKFGAIASDSLPFDIDAAIVASSTPSHHEIVAQLAQHGIKHILCEKPLAQDIEALDHIVDNVGDANVYTALVINFSPALAALAEFMEMHEVILLEFFGRWGKNRAVQTEKRPTAGDIEDEAVHPIGTLLQLVKIQGGPIRRASVNAMAGWLPYANAQAQQSAHERDRSFPLKPNHSTSANLRLFGEGYTVQAHIYSSFLLGQETRLIGGVLGRFPGEVVDAFEIAFDQKRPEKAGGAVDVLTIVHSRSNERTVVQEQGDKLNDLTRAFLTVAGGGAHDPRLATLDEAVTLVKIADAILQSDQEGLPQNVWF